MQIFQEGRSWRRVALRTLAALLVLYLALCAFLYARQTRFIFFPNKKVDFTPAVFGCEDFQSVNFGPHQLHGWWLPGRSPFTLIYHHGNAGNIGDNSEHACRLNKMGFTVFIFDYRGYGNSEGAFPAEKSVYEDSNEAWSLARSRGAAPERVLLYGHSLGGAIAIEMARIHPEAAGLIVESSFPSTYEMASHASHAMMFSFVPLKLILHQRFDAIEKVAKVAMPKLFIHGSADHVVPLEMGEDLYRAARGPKRLVIIRNGDHDNSAATDEAAYRRAVLDFVTPLPSRGHVTSDR